MFVEDRESEGMRWETIEKTEVGCIISDDGERWSEDERARRPVKRPLH